MTPIALGLRRVVLPALLVLAGVACGAVDRLDRPTPVPMQFFGLVMHRAATTTAWPGVPFASWVLWDSRQRWLDLEPQPGQWQFESFDKLVGLADQHGVEVVYVLGQTPAWATSRPDERHVYGPGAASPPADPAQFGAYVRQVATRYKGRIAAYGIWNEPKYRQGTGPCGGVVFFCGTPEDLVELTAAARAALRQVDPKALVLSPAFTGGLHGVDSLDRYLKAGGAGLIDAVAFHLYAAQPEDTVKTLAALRQTLQRHGLGQLPIWNTEQGWLVQSEAGTVQSDAGGGVFGRVYSPDEAAGLMARAMVLAAAGGVDRVHWYAWDNGRMGMIDPASAKPNAMATAYGVLQSWLVGATLQCAESTPRLAWACTVRRGGRSASLQWRTDGAASGALDKDSWVETLDGKKLALPAGQVPDMRGRAYLSSSDAKPW